MLWRGGFDTPLAIYDMMPLMLGRIMRCATPHIAPWFLRHVPIACVQVLATMTQLNKVGQQLLEMEGVHAMTDVTGFGLAGHLLEVARGSGVAACVDFGKVCVFRGLTWV
jgi:selenophosphate synthase